MVQRHQVLTPQSNQIKQFRISVQFLTHPQSYSVLTKQYALLNKMHTHTSQMTFNGIATMCLLVGGSMIRSGNLQLFWQLGTFPSGGRAQGNVSLHLQSLSQKFSLHQIVFVLNNGNVSS